MKKTEDAVSPVIGVMLMLVITIIIAAVVSVFAGGVITSDYTASKDTNNSCNDNGDNKHEHYTNYRRYSILSFLHMTVTSLSKRTVFVGW